MRVHEHQQPTTNNPQPTTIILIGYRGSGKTTVGRRLAERLGWGFVDLDEKIVAEQGRSIKDIFAAGGEALFREIESAAMKRAVSLSAHVISLGGGAVLAEANRRCLADSGHTVVYLSAGPEVLHERIIADPATAAQRPSLTHLGGGVEEIRHLLAAREPVYKSVMSFEVNACRSPEALAEEIGVRILGFRNFGVRSSGFRISEISDATDSRTET